MTVFYRAGYLPNRCRREYCIVHRIRLLSTIACGRISRVYPVRVLSRTCKSQYVGRRCKICAAGTTIALFVRAQRVLFFEQTDSFSVLSLPSFFFFLTIISVNVLRHGIGGFWKFFRARGETTVNGRSFARDRVFFCVPTCTHNVKSIDDEI